MNNFAAFILSNRRPDRIHTLKTLKRAGYSGKVFIVIDNEDPTQSQYKNTHGEMVVTFNRQKWFELTDDGDNFGKDKGVVYARNACWELAKELKVDSFIVLDDDYTNFEYRFRKDGSGCNLSMREGLDSVFQIMVEFLRQTPALSVAMSQGGDFIGGPTPEKRRLTRKCMNTFVCLTDRPFCFYGHINEDVNCYVTEGRRGKLFFTIPSVMVHQHATQTQPGGLTEYYLDVGTYVKSFYSVMYAPSCVTIGLMGDPAGGQTRIHHKINWDNAVPKILSQVHKKCKPNS